MNQLPRFLTVITVFWALYVASSMSVHAKELVLPKGHVIDFLMLTRKGDIAALRSQYFKDLYPLAKELGYQPLTGFGISQKPLTGYYAPDVLAVGAWPGDWQQRQQLFATLTESAPDIRSRRLDIWSSFNMLNVELKDTVSIHLDPQKTYVFSAFWLDADNTTDLLAQLRKAGAKLALTATDVKTMFGYTHAPQLVAITEWESKDAATQFNAKLAGSNSINKATQLFLDVKAKG